MLPNIQKYLFDIRVAIISINEYLGDKRDFTVYRQSKQLRRSVERELEIIGEAANKILQSDPDIPIDNARKIVNLRNWVIHSYDNVDDVIIWTIVNKHLPKLLQQVNTLLQDYDECNF
jgi:uncharacterized protein with HEPN domain